jgi:hypothetical protein
MLGREQERERFAAYFHRRLAPDLLALAFSIEGVRAELEAQDHPSTPKLRELLNRLTGMIKPMREEILNEGWLCALKIAHEKRFCWKRRLVRNTENHIGTADRTFLVGTAGQPCRLAKANHGVSESDSR